MRTSVPALLGWMYHRYLVPLLRRHLAGVVLGGPYESTARISRMQGMDMDIATPYFFQVCVGHACFRSMEYSLALGAAGRMQSC